VPPSSGYYKKRLTNLMTEAARISGTMIGEERYNNLEECMYSTVLNSCYRCCCGRCLNTTLQYTRRVQKETEIF